MTEIYLIRHAQAEGNLYRMMQGHWDGDVTAMGCRQIDALAQRFRDVRIDALYSSDLYRTRLTASAITRYHPVDMVLCKELREINVGPWETLFFANVFHDEPEQAGYFIHDPEKWHIDGAETYRQVGDRAYDFLEKLAREHQGQSLAVVSHGVTIRCLLSRICGINLQDTKKLPICRNTAVSKLSWQEGGFRAEYINDYSHILHLGDSGWTKGADLRHQAIDPEAEREYYESCYAGAWQAAHGSLEGYSPLPYLSSAIEHHRQNSQAVMKFFDRERPAGLLDLDTARGAHAGYGWISLIYLEEDYRNKGYGIQLLARAIWLYSRLGRKRLRLHAAADNGQALAFYRAHGFKELAREEGGRLLLMERSLERSRDV